MSSEPTSDLFNGAVNYPKTGLEVSFAQSIGVVYVRSRPAAPQPKQRHLCTRSLRKPQQLPAMPRFHAYPEIAGRQRQSATPRLMVAQLEAELPGNFHPC